MYEENGQIHSVEDGEYICQKWNGSEFETLKIGQSAKQSNVEITGVENAPFEPKYKEELCIGGERKLTWKKINVDGTDLPRLTMSVTWHKFMRTVNLLQMITITARRGECRVNCFTAKNVIW